MSITAVSSTPPILQEIKKKKKNLTPPQPIPNHSQQNPPHPDLRKLVPAGLAIPLQLPFPPTLKPSLLLLLLLLRRRRGRRGSVINTIRLGFANLASAVAIVHAGVDAPDIRAVAVAAYLVTPF